MLPKQRSMHFPAHLHICIVMHLICTMSFLFSVSSYCSSSFDNALHWGSMRVFRLIDSSSDAHLQPWFDAMGPNLRSSNFIISFLLKFVSDHSNLSFQPTASPSSNNLCFAGLSKNRVPQIVHGALKGRGISSNHQTGNSIVSVSGHFCPKDTFYFLRTFI